jgi:hypothetical protein
LDRLPYSSENNLLCAYPDKVLGATEYTENSMFYWVAVTGWEKWGRRADISAEVKTMNQIDVTTSNINEMTLFIPKSLISPADPVTLTIDGKNVVIKKLNKANSLACKKSGNGWRVRCSKQSADQYRSEPHIIGKLKRAYDCPDQSGNLARLLAKIMMWRFETDLAIASIDNCQGKIPSGLITVDGILNALYPNKICTFTADKAQIERLAGFNSKLDAEDRCVFTGCILSGNTAGSVTTDLVQERKYTVAAPDYLLQNAKEYFGEEIQYSPGTVSLPEAVIDCFLKNKALLK